MSRAELKFNIDSLVDALEGAKVSPSGVTFAGKSLKLNTEDDAKPVIEAINNCRDLQYLNLEGNTLGVDASKVIAQALEKHPEFKRALWKDMFTGRLKSEIPKSLEFLGHGLVAAGVRLIELDLSDNAFGPIGVEGLASLLKSSTCYALEELRLNNNGLGISGGKLLASALTDCYNSSKSEGKPLALKVFIAGRNRLENEGAKALAAVFQLIGTLEEVAMPQNGIYHVGISALSEAFTYNTNLQVLNLNDNTFGEKGAQAIANALPRLQNLKEINFGDCLLKTKGAIVLAQALKETHKNLENVILASNEIKIQGGLELVKAMANKGKLKHLMLDGNQFGEEGANEIKRELKAIGKLNVLGSLEENEEEDSDEDDNDTDENSNAEEDDDSNEVETEQIVTVQEFFKTPSGENFIGLGERRFELIISEVKINGDVNIDHYLTVLMKVAALSDNSRTEVAQSALKVSQNLYRDLFTWAQKADKLSQVNNAILVNLGLIKCEDKKFRPISNVSGCFSTLKSIAKLNFVPDSTKDTFKLFMKREIEKNGTYLQLKKDILAALD